MKDNEFWSRVSVSNNRLVVMLCVLAVLAPIVHFAPNILKYFA